MTQARSRWLRHRAGLYTCTGADGLHYRAERMGGWWVLQCGTVRTRYETLGAAQARVP